MSESATTVEQGSGPTTGLTLEEAEVRRRIAAELHDGILQILTAASFQIETILRIGTTDPDEAFARLRSVGAAIADEQRELRLFIEEYRDEESELLGEHRSFPVRLRETLDRVGQIWDARVTVVDEPLALDAEQTRTVLRLVHEAVVNAVRHGAARHVEVHVRGDADGVELRIRDDGPGFSFQGSLDLDELRARRLGPISLKRRVEAARGCLRIDSSPEGADIFITLPFPGVPS